MKRTFYISAIYTSPPSTMGGNTKIMLEMINHLYDEYDFVIFTTQPDTFKKHIKHFSKIKVITVPYPFEKFKLLTHYREIKWVSDFYEKYFSKHKMLPTDYFFSPSDFAPDVLPIYNLKKNHKFIWAPTLFLFIPSPIENIVNGYKFPFVKYVLYFFYQRYLFSKMLEKADLFVITNDSDKKMFPKKFKNKILAIYGGVNTEFIEALKNKEYKKEYDAVFCSRLHPQKGISQLLDIWAKVVQEIPNAKLAVMGNGDPKFEKSLKEKCHRLGLDNKIAWLGFVDGLEKYKIYKKSKMLVHATIYDNNGMVAAEALCSGLPVVMYDLNSLKHVYSIGCAKIPLYSKSKFSSVIIRLISDSKYIQSLKLTRSHQNELITYWSWDNRIEIINKSLKKVNI